MTDVLASLLAPAAGIDLDLSLRVFGTPPPDVIGIEKDHHDLMRWARVIALDGPEVLIECGTNTGFSANWFADRVAHVITIDIDARRVVAPHDPNRVTRMSGDSTNPDVVAAVTRMVAGRRVTISLDSDHTPAHVQREIELWAPLVSQGCHLVVEDGIYHWIRDSHHPDWDPLIAISRTMPFRLDFDRDERTEGAHLITGSPAGWWVKV